MTDLNAPTDGILRPNESGVLRLAQKLAAQAERLDESGEWPSHQLDQCSELGIFRWFVGSGRGGIGCSEADILSGYLQLSSSCLTTSFILTQITGALRRVAASRAAIVESVLDDLLSGHSLASLGISHLTTSHRHLGKKILSAESNGKGFTLNGFSPWVTGSPHIDWIVVGAEIDDGRQILGLVSMDQPGITVDPPTKLMALTGSQTGAVRFDQVKLEADRILAGPKAEVLVAATGASSGGLQTSALAIGLADSAISLIEEQTAGRSDLVEPANRLRAEQNAAKEDLLSLAMGGKVCSPGELRGRSNSLAMRSSQAALAAVKGAGYVQGHPAGRICREALFFLVWSCPQPVMAANLCELAGLSE